VEGYPDDVTILYRCENIKKCTLTVMLCYKDSFIIKLEKLFDRRLYPYKFEIYRH